VAYFDGGDGGIIHGTTRGFGLGAKRNYNYAGDKRCPDCGVLIQQKSTRCKPCAQKMRRKIEGQVARLLALAKQRREEREAADE